MDVKWKSGADPKILFNKIMEDWNNDSEKNSFAFILNPEYQSLLLQNLLDFSSDVPSFIIWNIIKSTLYKSSAKRQIKPEEFLKETRQAVKDYLTQESEKFVIFTSISVPPNIVINPIKYSNSKITFNDTKKRLFAISAEGEIQKAKNGLRCNLPTNYLPVRITVTAKTVNESFLAADYILNIYRALANFVLKYNHITVSSIPTDPINKIVTGPIHTIHHTNSKIANPDNSWIESDYAGPIFNLLSNQKSIDQMNDFVRMAFKKLRIHPYRDFMEKILIRYVQALDTRDYLSTSLKLWSIIEALTGAEDKKSDKLIDRATFLFGDKRYYAWELNQLKEFRNYVIHHGKSTPNEESYAYMYKKYVDVLIRFHLLNNFHFKSKQEAFDFLDTPTDLTIINSKEKNLRIAKKIILKKKAQ